MIKTWKRQKNEAGLGIVIKLKKPVFFFKLIVIKLNYKIIHYIKNAKRQSHFKSCIPQGKIKSC